MALPVFLKTVNHLLGPARNIRIPGLSGGANAEKRARERVVDRALQTGAFAQGKVVSRHLPSSAIGGFKRHFLPRAAQDGQFVSIDGDRQGLVSRDEFLAGAKRQARYAIGLDFDRRDVGVGDRMDCGQ